MRYLTFQPAISLAPIIQIYWTLENDSSSGCGIFERVLPDGCSEIVIHSGDRFQQLVDGRVIEQPRSLVVGQMSRFIKIAPTGKSAMVGIRFHPGGLHRLFGIPVWETRDQVIEMHSLLGPLSREVEERVAQTAQPFERIRAIESLLLRQLSRARAEDYAVSVTLGKLDRQHRRVRVREIAAGLAISERQLERRFQTAVGLSLRAYTRLRRFQSVMRLWAICPQLPLAATAYECGYADQSHFQREFLGFAGITPGEYRRERHLLADQFALEPVSETFKTNHRSVR